MKALLSHLVRRPELEAFCWIIALLSLIFLDPYEQTHFSLCFFKLLGFDRCPGCGLGHAIAFLYRGEVVHSFQTHWLGIPAVILILRQCFQILYKPLSKIIINREGDQHGAGNTNFTGTTRRGANFRSRFNKRSSR
ncbi:MAG: DUF2752 domain-containing protein [Calditrichae bacterium]|nr:DUF2752 domain-containing protein [Calditrichia bacterium]